MAVKEMKATPHLAVVELLGENAGGPIPLENLGVYVMASNSDPMDFHLVVHVSEDVWLCKCKSARYRGTCSAIKQLTGTV